MEDLDDRLLVAAYIPNFSPIHHDRITDKNSIPIHRKVLLAFRFTMKINGNLSIR